MIETINYGPAFEKTHVDFASRYWTKRKRITANYIYWKFRGVPGKELPGFILAIDHGRVIGQLGVIPCVVNMGGSAIAGQWACDLMVDSNYRGKSIAAMLYKHAYKMKPITLGSDPSPAASISMERAGFKRLKGPWKFFFPMYLGEICRVKGIKVQLLDKILNPLLYLLKIWRFFIKRNAFRAIDADTFSQLLNEWNKSSAISITRDHDFIRWRYSSYENFYNGISAYQYNDKAIFSIYKSSNLFLVTDFFANDLKSSIDVLAEIILQARRAGVRSVKVLSNSKMEYKALRISGFIKFKTRTNIIYYTEDPKIQSLLQEKSFHYTYVDSDENI